MHGRDPDPDDEATLRETIAALEMPPDGLRKWLRQGQAFCNGHGGKRHYGELLDLYAECLDLLDRPRGSERG